MPVKVALSLGVVIMGVGVTVTGSSADTPAVAIAGWVLFSIGECVFAPMSNSYVAELSDGTVQGRAQGRLAAFQSTGSALGPGLGSWMLFALHGGAWVGFLGLTLASATLVLSAGRFRASTTGRPHGHAAD